MTARQAPQVNNTSTVPGMRIRIRRTRTGLLRAFIAVSWNERDRSTGRPRRRGTDIPTEGGPLLAVYRALELRKRHAGAACPLTPRQVWLRLVRASNLKELRDE